MHRDCLLLLKVMMKAHDGFFFKCPFLSKYNRSTYACPSQPKNRGSRYQPPLPNATTVTVGWYHGTSRDGRWEHSRRTGLTEPKAWLCIPRPCCINTHRLRGDRLGEHLLPPSHVPGAAGSAFCVSSHWSSHLEELTWRICCFLKTLAILYRN